MANEQVQPPSGPALAGDLWTAALDQADAQIGHSQQTASEDPYATPAPAPGISMDQAAEEARQGIMPEMVDEVGQQPGDQRRNADLVKSIGAGAAKAAFETKDFVVGEPNFADKSKFRQDVETGQTERERNSPVNGIARTLTQFGVGFYGLGKVTPLKGGIGSIGGWAKDAVRAATVGAVAFDPHEERLSNIVERYPFLSNPLTRYLAADIKDSKAEGRFKAAVESLTLDVTVATAFALSARAMKLFRAGDHKAAQEALEEANDKFTEAASTYFVTPHGDAVPDLQTAKFAMDARAKTENLQAQQTAFEERAAILEHDGGHPKAEAERLAREEIYGGLGQNAEGLPREAAPRLDEATPPVARAEGDARETSTAPQPTPQATQPLEPGTEVVPRGSVRAETQPAHEVPEVDLEKTLPRMRADNRAIEKAGSMEEAIADGHRFGGQDMIPWQKLNGPDEVHAWVGQIVEDNEALINAAKGGNKAGVMTDAQVEAMVSQRARVFNEDPNLLMGMLRGAGEKAKTMVANMETSFLLANKAFMDTYELARRLEVENYTGFASRVEAEAALKHRLGMALEMMAASKAMLASAGRTMRRARGEFKTRSDAMAAIKLDGLDANALRKAILSTEGDTAGIAKLGQPGYYGKIVDWLGGFQAANLLWGWATHTVNATLNVAMTQMRPLQNWMGAAGQGAYAVIKGDAALAAQAQTTRIKARREAIYVAANIAEGWSAAKWAFMNGDSRLAPHTIEATTDATGALRPGQGAIVFREVKSMNDVVANALLAANFSLHGSLRLMGTVDEVVKTIRYRSVVMAKASIDADELGLKQGSKEYGAYIKRRTEDAFDKDGRAVDGDALGEAQATTFQQDLLEGGTGDTWGNMKSFGALWQQGVAQNATLRLVTPFVKTPTNLFRNGVKLTPGLNLLQREYFNAITGAKGAEQQATAIGQMMLGTLLMSSAVQLRMDGRITGSGPQSPQASKAWKDQGNQPYAIVVQDGEQKSYIQINRLDPIQFPFALAADITDLVMGGQLSKEDEETLYSAALLAVTHQMKDKLYLKNVGAMLEAVTDPDKMRTLGQRTLPNFIPWSTLHRGVNPDPYIHEVHSYVDALKAVLPGFSDDVPKRYDVFGDPVKVPGRFVNDQANAGPLAQALDESYAMTGNYLLPPSPKVGTDGLDLRDVTLESGRNAFERYQELVGRPKEGIPSLKESLVSIIGTDAFKAAPHGRTSENSTKEWMLMSEVRKYRDAAMDVLKRESPELRKQVGKRAEEIFNAAMSGKKDINAAASRATADDIQGLLRGYGLGGAAGTP